MPTYSDDILRLAEANMVPLLPGEPTVELANRLCGDRIIIAAAVQVGGALEIHWQAEGCAILKASAAYLARTLKGISREAALQRVSEFMRTFEVEAKSTPEGPLAPVYKLPARYKCALLPWQACENFLRERR
ncbi:iron-sulfur cluster assembly scaffold protein [Turneriella parva]|uniref:NifU family SUF system FeS assembly protein n=1 Tax=Turneriella parva (strain ATCC BAA-1111 / DSM 21527 / NCTC 11395 / H) TaxID=869212 RepID=I4B239_TURPD|nr:iron-sulfur cluster assembly scaffold protein [Turneriella parva]AFM11346.1 NifU family SUF system FeS assembly protein [Turneriella parva DSM 21527]